MEHKTIPPNPALSFMKALANISRNQLQWKDEVLKKSNQVATTNTNTNGWRNIGSIIPDGQPQTVMFNKKGVHI